MLFSKKKSAKKSKAKGVEPDAPSAYRRGRRPVKVRRGLFDWRSWPWQRAALASGVVISASFGIAFARDHLATSERFRFDRDGLRITGVEYLDESSLRSLFAADFGLSLASIPIVERRERILEEPWIRRAVVARQWPNRLWVDIEERRPAAFVRAPEGAGGTMTLRLIDGEGRFLEPIEGVRWELPVVDGLTLETPEQERSRRLGVLASMMVELDREDPRYGERLSQINLSEPDNVRVMAEHEGDVIELHLGDEHFRHRFETFDRYIDVWKRRFGDVASIDLRWEKQAIVQPVRETADASRR